MAAKYAAMGRIHFVHMRNVQILDNGFEERAHLSSCGSLDMYAIMKALYDNGFRGYIRPDHGRMICIRCYLLKWFMGSYRKS